MSDTVIEVENLGKKFCRSLKRSLYYGTVDAARAMLGFPNRNPDLRPGEFWALDEVSFTLKRGESLGLIGTNGCGKSTLLRLLTGIFPPDKGRIKVQGRMASLIAVGAGFHPHMSGAENIYLNGTLLGLTPGELRQSFDEIVEFAEIGEFIHSPVSVYSSGMRVRLGFAIAIHVQPEILLVDEVMSVGDTRFRRKASDAMSNLLAQERTALILVSHNAFTVSNQCNKAILLEKGAIQFAGPVDEAYEAYRKLHDIESGPAAQEGNENFTHFSVRSPSGENRINSREPFIIQFGVKEYLIPESDLPLTITVFDSDYNPVLSLQTKEQSVPPLRNYRLKAQGLPLSNGSYTMQCKIGSEFHGTSVYKGHRFEVMEGKRSSTTAICFDLEALDADCPDSGIPHGPSLESI